LRLHDPIFINWANRLRVTVTIRPAFLFGNSFIDLVMCFSHTLLYIRLLQNFKDCPLAQFSGCGIHKSAQGMSIASFFADYLAEIILGGSQFNH